MKFKKIKNKIERKEKEKKGIIIEKGMRIEIIVLAITLFFAANAYYEGKLLKKMLSYKKYYQIGAIIFMGFSFYMYMKKDPKNGTAVLSSANNLLKSLPINMTMGPNTDYLTPFMDFTMRNQGFTENSPLLAGSSSRESRILSSGAGGGGGGGQTKRSVSESKKKYVAASQGWRCGECNRQLPAWFEVDHKIRLADGGSNHVDNLVALCRDCHGQKTMIENL